MIDLDGLPGRDLIERGLRDRQQGKKSPESLLVAMAAPRLRDLGLPVSDADPHGDEPELSLYALLGESGDLDPYSRYNALRRELASFVHALEQRVGRERRRALHG